MNQQEGFANKCQVYLTARWTEISNRLESEGSCDILDSGYADVKQAIVCCLTSSIKSYHYVLPTQLLAKCVDPSLDARSLQVAWGQPGAFDARTIAHHVIVPFDRNNDRVLGGSPEPYVNNPLRCPAVTSEYRDQQKNKTDWDMLVALLEQVETSGDANLATGMLDQVLVEVHRLLATVRVAYPTPNRISLAAAQKLVSDYLSTPSGGERNESVCTALFLTLAHEFAVFDRINREKTNVADAAKGAAGDIECWLGDKLVLLVEVKDRALSFTQLDTTLDTARSNRISEILFVAEQGKEASDQEAIDERIRQEFTSGQNVYVTDLQAFALGVLILLGEKGRVGFLHQVGEELDRTSAAIAHRRAWSDLLKAV